VNFFDTADLYANGRSEELIGKALGTRRSRVLIATKFGMAKGELPFQEGAGRRWIIESVEASLRRLRTDFIDLYQVHQPDSKTPILETLECLDDLVHMGKIRYHGHSNFKAHQIADAEWTARVEHLVRPVSAQHHYNLIRRDPEAELLPACAAYGLGFIPFFPLASGFLTGKYRDNSIPEGARLSGSPGSDRILTQANFRRLDRLEAFAKERGHSIAELALGWLLTRVEVVSVIAGASRPEQVLLNVQASNWRLTQDEMDMVAEL
jgi:aryl-alcohol dehydrogenase-like predicted oxidoreductase